jgi:hypothetical protein
LFCEGLAHEGASGWPGRDTNGTAGPAARLDVAGRGADATTGPAAGLGGAGATA